MPGWIDSLAALWRALLVHQWQTMILWAVILLLVWLLRSAPARLRHALLLAGLIKLWLPSAVLGRCGGWILDRFACAPAAITENALAGPLWEGAALALRPPLLRPGFLPAATGATIALVMTAVWVGLFVFLARRWTRQTDRGALPHPRKERAPADAAVSLDLAGRLDAALRTTGIPAERVRVTPHHVVPALRGLRRPEIVLPAALVRALSTEELRGILHHEYAHLRRRDGWLLLLQRSTLLAFPYNPLLHLIHRRMTAAAEAACDEAVVRAGVSGPVFARALARTIALGFAPAGDHVAACCSRRSTLGERLVRLHSEGGPKMTHRHRWILVLGLVLITAGTFGPWEGSRSVAASATDAEAETAPPAVESDSAKSQEAPHYDTPPALISRHGAEPEYPADAARDKVAGRVEIKLTLGPDGSITRIEAVREVPGYPSLTESAIAAIRQWEFAPAKYKDQPVPCAILVPVEFAKD